LVLMVVTPPARLPATKPMTIKLLSERVFMTKSSSLILNFELVISIRPANLRTTSHPWVLPHSTDTTGQISFPDLGSGQVVLSFG